MFQGSRVGSVAASATTWGSFGVGDWGSRGGVRWWGNTAPPSGTLAPGHLLGSPCALASTVAEGGTISDRGRRLLVQLRCLTPRHAGVPEGHWGTFWVIRNQELYAGSCRRLMNLDMKKDWKRANFQSLGCAGRGGAGGNSSQSLFLPLRPGWPPNHSASLPDFKLCFPAWTFPHPCDAL